MLVPALRRPVSLIGLIWILSPHQTSAEGWVGGWVHIRGGHDDKSLTFGAAKIPHHEPETLMEAKVMPTCTNKTGMWKKRNSKQVIGTCVDGAEGQPDRRGLRSPTLKNVITEPTGVRTATKRLKSRLSVIYACFRVLISRADARFGPQGETRVKTR